MAGYKAIYTVNIDVQIRKKYAIAGLNTLGSMSRLVQRAQVDYVSILGDDDTVQIDSSVEKDDLLEFGSFIKDETDETYNTEKSLNYNELRKARKYMMTMLEVDPLESNTEEKDYDEDNSLNERFAISFIEYHPVPPEAFHLENLLRL